MVDNNTNLFLGSSTVFKQWTVDSSGTLTSIWSDDVQCKKMNVVLPLGWSLDSQSYSNQNLDCPLISTPIAALLLKYDYSLMVYHAL